MKYVGSKRRIAKPVSDILHSAMLTNNIEKYCEPFVGGCNMMEHITCKTKIGLDSNEYLIEMWKALQAGWNPPESLSRWEYESIRDDKDSYKKEMVAFAGLVATYNAKWFGGYAGIVKTKAGTTRNYYDEARRNILKQLPKLLSVKLKTRNFLDIDPTKPTKYVIYCDPPYANTTKYKDDFPTKDFWEWVRILSAKNKVYVSEYVAPSDFTAIWTKKVTTTLDKNSRKADTENLFTLLSSYF